MLSQVHIQIVTKLTEIILQTRLDVRKSLFNHLHDLFSSFKSHNKHKPGTLYQFLAISILKDNYHIKQKLPTKLQGGRLSSQVTVLVIFTLIQRTTGAKFCVESWVVSAIRKKYQKTQESILTVVQFFQEVFLILNKLPLISIYHKHKQMKNRYLLDYKILFENFKDFTLFQQRGQSHIQRQTNSLILYAKVTYCPCLLFLSKIQSQLMNRESRKSSAISDFQQNRKVSVYEFYDQELDFTFLSSEEQNFKLGGNQSLQIKIQMDNQWISEQFELLISNQDQQFFNESQQMFEFLMKNEKKYLFQ